MAVVLHELLKLDVFRHRLARALGLSELFPRQLQRLAALAALHDVGKCNHGFQDGREASQWLTHGHVREIFKLLFDHPRSEDGFTALRLGELTAWFTESINSSTQDSPGPLEGWLWAVFCHHGRPLKGDPYVLGKPQELNKISEKVWNHGPQRDPLEGLAQLADAVRCTFVDAFATEGEPLPLTAAGQHLFNGLVTLADWIASDDQLFFPFSPDATLPSLEILSGKAWRALDSLGLDLRQARKNLMARSPGFKTLFGFPHPNPMQQAIAQLPVPSAQHVVILEAETGSGKTEAALWYFFKLFAAGQVDGLYFALPTRAAAVQIHERVRCAMLNAFGPDHPQVVLAVLRLS